MEIAELHQAFSWICNNCGQRNFERAVTMEMSPEDIEEAKNEFGMEPWEEGNFLTAPDIVKCKNCGKEYETEV